jgi:NAD(P)-dependent dehydrogenase (short-subunit alcohol dehydrogenase family)
MEGALGGRHVVITGGRGALGTAVVDAFLAAGATCHLPERRSSDSPDPRPGVEVVAGVDLASEDRVAAFYGALPPLWASIHLAGGFAAAPVLRMTLADFRAQLDTNLVTTFLCCREAVRNMAAARAGGRIVNIASRAALVPSGGSLAYATAKAAVVALTRSLAEEVRPQAILVNAVAPSTIDTPSNRAAMPTANPARWSSPADLAGTILWLASPANALTSGAVIPAYGNA